MAADLEREHQRHCEALTALAARFDAFVHSQASVAHVRLPVARALSPSVTTRRPCAAHGDHDVRRRHFVDDTFGVPSRGQLMRKLKLLRAAIPAYPDPAGVLMSSPCR